MSRPRWRVDTTGLAVACAVLGMTALMGSPVQAAAQLLSTRSDGLSPALAGLFPDDWSDGVLNPAALPMGRLAFGRFDWQPDLRGGRRAVLGARASGRSMALLGAVALDVSRPWSAGSHGTIAVRHRGDANIGVRYALFRPDTLGDPGYSLLAAYRAEAGDGWVMDILGESAVVPGAGGDERRPRNSYIAAELLLRQPGPDRGLTDFGWRQRLVRVRAGVGNGDDADPTASATWRALQWIEGSIAHLHRRDLGQASLAAAWALRATSFGIDRVCPAIGACEPAEDGDRRALALDAAIELRPVTTVALRGGASWLLLESGSTRYAPAHWQDHATLVPMRFANGAWAGLGWDVRSELALDVAVDALSAEDDPDLGPVTIQATYRF